jgi:hypothetical protein
MKSGARYKFTSASLLKAHYYSSLLLVFPYSHFLVSSYHRSVVLSCPPAAVPSFFRAPIYETQALRLYYYTCSYIAAYCFAPTAYLLYSFQTT